MNKREKIEIIILAILIIILAISVWAGIKNKKTTKTLDVCDVLCIENQEGTWEFRGQILPSKEDCFTECQTSFTEENE